jgi:hypothetical protein
MIQIGPRPTHLVLNVCELSHGREVALPLRDHRVRDRERIRHPPRRRRHDRFGILGTLDMQMVQHLGLSLVCSMHACGPLRMLFFTPKPRGQPTSPSAGTEEQPAEIRQLTA